MTEILATIFVLKENKNKTVGFFSLNFTI